LLGSRLKGPDAGDVCLVLSSICTVSSVWAPHFKGETCSTLVELLGRESIKRGAAAVIANLSFHSDFLYGDFRSAVPLLVQMVRDTSDFDAASRTNAASALVNLVRNGAALEDIMLEHAMPSALADWAESATTSEEFASSLHVLISLASLPWPKLNSAVLRHAKLDTIMARKDEFQLENIHSLVKRLERKRSFPSAV